MQCLHCFCVGDAWNCGEGDVLVGQRSGSKCMVDEWPRERERGARQNLQMNVQQNGRDVKFRETKRSGVQE